VEMGRKGEGPVGLTLREREGVWSGAAATWHAWHGDHEQAA
jgi:hypothetical protein